MLLYGADGTGKSTVAMDVVINRQHFEPLVQVIYVMMGQPAEAVKRQVQQLEQAGAMNYTTVIVADDKSSPLHQFMAPLTACAMGEHYRDRGKHALVVYDDITQHIITYDRLCKQLLDSYTQSLGKHILWRHMYSSLFQRSACLSDAKGGGTLSSLICLQSPPLEPFELMSTSDGQIKLCEKRFANGQLPAIDPPASLSRIGSRARSEG